MKDNGRIKILFADDEQIMREGILLTVNWAAYNFDVVGAAANGEQALALFRENPADIVVTDIRMPVMDGLALTRELLRIAPDTRVVILSAYNEFEYAQQALRLGAHEYILKADLDCDSLLSLTLKIAKDIARHRNEQKESQQLEQKMKHHLDALQQGFLRGLVSKNGYAPELAAQAEALGLRLEGQDIMLFHITADTPLPKPAFLAQALSPVFRNVYAVQEEEGHVLVFCNAPAGPGGAATHAIPAKAADAIRAVAKGTICLLLCAPFGGYENCQHFNELLLTTLQFCRFYGDCPVALVTGPPAYGSEEELRGGLSGVFLNLERNSFYDAYEETKLAIDRAAQLRCQPEAVKELLCMLLHLYTDRIYSAGVVQGEEANAVLAPFKQGRTLRQAVYAYDRFSRLAADVTGLFQELTQFVSGRLYPYGRIVSSALDYINRHLGEELTLNLVAQEVFCSPAYLSQLFKKDVGQNFSEYLLASRIKLAKILLSTTSMPVREVAERVGIPNASYFSKVFTKAVGMQPNRYRATEYI